MHGPAAGAGPPLLAGGPRDLRAPTGRRLVASSQSATSHSLVRGPQEGEAVVPPPSALMAVGGPALFVVGNTTLGAGDLVVRNRLQALGLTVTVKLDINAATASGHNALRIRAVISSPNRGSST